MVVRLEPMSDAHLGHIEALVQDPAVLRFTRVPEPVPDGFAQGWIRRYEAARPEGTADGFAAFDGSAFVGLGLVPQIDAAAREAELGYIVAPHARGRGAGTAILRALTAWAVDDLGLLRLELVIDTGNGASRKVAERAGYTLEGVKRSLHVKQDHRADCEIWSCLADEFSRPVPSQVT
jgi:RimJ/RimL family protein N-acetyltransferase